MSQLFVHAVAAWLFLDETLKKSKNDNENSETDSMATVDSLTMECDFDSVLTIETDLTSDAMVTDDTMVTANDKVVEDSTSQTSVEDVEPLIEQGPKVEKNWKANFWVLFYDRVYCCRGFNARKINYKFSRRDLYSARDKIITMGKLMMDRRVIVSASLYGLLGFVAITVNEVMMMIVLCWIT